MAYKALESFVYNGISSKNPLQEPNPSIEIFNVSLDTGLLEEDFLAEAEIVEVPTRGRTKPYFQYKLKNPLILSLNFAILGQWDEEGHKLRALARWLNQDSYKPLTFFSGEEPGEEAATVYHAMYIGNPRLIHTGAKEGYITLDMRCNDITAYSSVFVTEEHIYEDNEEGEELIFNNLGDLKLSPEMVLLKIGDGDFGISNLSDGGKLSLFSNLEDGDLIYVNNETENIIAFSKHFYPAMLVEDKEVSLFDEPDLTKPFQIFYEDNLIDPQEFSIKENEGEWSVVFNTTDYDNKTIDIYYYFKKSDIYRYSHHNGEFLTLLPYSENILKIFGDGKIRFRYQFAKLH